MLPNLVVIGAAKCGTTSLHHYLDLHPEIAMSRVKELNFFCSEPDTRTLAWYEAQFRDARVRGESSPWYSMEPRFPGAAARMARVIPDAMLVYVVRDPVERFVSSWRYGRYATRQEADRLEEALADPAAEQRIVTSLYARQLEPFLEHFPRERILVLDQADLEARRAETIAHVFRFVGVDDAFRSPGFERRHNPTDGELRPNGIGRTAIAVSERLLGERRTVALRHRTPQRPVRLLLHRPEIPRLELQPDQRRRLEDFLRPDAARFRELTGLPFEHWCV